MTLKKLKLAAISQEFSDAEVEQFFLDLELSGAETIDEAFAILQRYRPEVLKKIALKHLSGPKLSD